VAKNSLWQLSFTLRGRVLLVRTVILCLRRSSRVVEAVYCELEVESDFIEVDLCVG
jgi:hypothetical protein